MAEYKLNIGDPNTKKTYTKQVKDDLARPLVGKSIGDNISGDAIGLEGYEFQITGGTDNAGFPLRKGVVGGIRKKILVAGGVGFKNKKKREGLRIKKTVATQVISPVTVQVNLKVLKQGKEKLGGEEKAEEKAETKEAN